MPKQSRRNRARATAAPARAHESMRETFRSVFAEGGLTGEALEARIEERMCDPGPFDVLDTVSERAPVSDFEVAFAAARDILEWPTVNLQRIALADIETQRKFVEWVKQTLMESGGVESGGD